MRERQKIDTSPSWVDFTRRTNDPKLAYIERLLKERGIPFRRFGRSFHAPILQVHSNRLDEAWAVLDMPMTGPGGKPTTFDELPDDHPTFRESV